jgi:muconolactone delta-isomerase
MAMRQWYTVAMEFLVSMTTHVPPGTTDQQVDAMRAREAAHSAELATQGQLLRLWRPPLAPGEWRSYGLFSAENEEALDAVLTSMPLRVWRTDTVTPLGRHPNDPATTQGRPPEYFTWFTSAIPAGTPQDALEEKTAGEAVRTRELAAEGRLLRLWMLPAEGAMWHALGLWSVDDPSEVQSMLESLPMYGWMTIETTPLTRHPSDPGSS